MDIFFLLYANKLYFTADDGTHGREPWVYDGTSTSLLMDVYLGISGSYPSEFTIWNNKLYMTLATNGTGYELYSFADKTMIQNVAFAADIKVYPNPATSDINFEFTPAERVALSLKVTDFSGREVFGSEQREYDATKHIIAIPMQNLPAGDYYYNLYNQAGLVYASGKIVKD